MLKKRKALKQVTITTLSMVVDMLREKEELTEQDKARIFDTYEEEIIDLLTKRIVEAKEMVRKTIL